MRQPCDLLLTNAHVLTMDDQFTTYQGGAVAVRDGAIIAVGDIAARVDPVETLDCGGRVVMPGLVDRKSTRLNSSHSQQSRMPSSA